MKRFLIIGDRLKDILPHDFTVLWIGEAENTGDALRKHEAIHPPSNYRIHKVIEITREYELPYDGW